MDLAFFYIIEGTPCFFNTLLAQVRNYRMSLFCRKERKECKLINGGNGATIENEINASASRGCKPVDMKCNKLS